MFKFLGQNCTFLSIAANCSRMGQCFQQEVSHWFHDMRVPNFLLHSLQKKMDYWPKTAKLGQKFRFKGPPQGLY